MPYPCTGSSTAIVVPFFELSSTRTQPPWRLAISHTKESPSPTPPYSRLRDLSTRKKLKDALLVFLRDAAAGVGNADQNLFRLLRNRNLHRAARTVVLDCIFR